MTNSTERQTQADALNELRAQLETCSLQELRSKAKSNFGVSITRTHTKEDIIHLIVKESEKFEFALEAAGALKPGWTRIKLHPTQGRSLFPLYTNVNGKSFCIPINKEIDVPNKIAHALGNAIESIPQVDEDFKVTGFEDNLSYPFTIIEQRDGPDPKPGFEVQREAKQKIKHEFEAKHGYWPSDAVIAQQRQLTLIKGQ